MAQEWKNIEAEIFFTFFGLKPFIRKIGTPARLATVGNPAMHIPTMLGGLPGMESLATMMMKKEMEKLMPDVHEFLDIMVASEWNSGPADWPWTCSIIKRRYVRWKMEVSSP